PLGGRQRADSPEVRADGAVPGVAVARRAALSRQPQAHLDCLQSRPVMAAPYQRIAVIGAGAWGTALAVVARRAGRNAVIVAREPAVAAAINTAHENAQYLPGIRLDDAILATDDAGEAVSAAEAVLLAAPAQHLRAVASRIAPH